jgi:hypothetical protein
MMDDKRRGITFALLFFQSNLQTRQEQFLVGFLLLDKIIRI